MTTNKPEVLGFTTHHDEPMLFPSKREAAMYCDDGEEPMALIRLSDYETRMAVLFDGHAVYSAMTDKAKQHTSPESVAVVLDAVAKLMGEVTHG